MLSLHLRFFTVAATLSAAAFACSAGNDGTSPDGDADGSGANGSGGAGGGLLLGGGSTVGDGCSADLQSVVDEAGNTVTTCPPDQGCFEGQCVPACEAAAKSTGSIGCEFWTPNSPFYLNGAGSTYDGACYAMFIANTWGKAAQITVEYQGQSLDASAFSYIPNGTPPAVTYEPLPASGLPPNEVAVVFLAHKPGAVHGLGSSLECPLPPAILQDLAVVGSGIGSAFRVVVDTPVIAYDILPYGGARSYLPSASLLIPSTAWGTNYYAVGPRQDGGGPFWTLIVGSVDGTTVDVAPTNTLPGGGALAAAPAGQTTTFTIGAGEVLQWQGDGTGTIFQSSQPIGLWTGSAYLQVASATSPSGGGQDSAHQQIPHITALGSEYVGGGVVTRLSSLAPESVPYRVFGVVDGTTLAYDPAPPPGAPTALAAGQFVEFESTTLFSVRSQDADHPFAFTQYMPGTPGLTRPGCGPTPPFAGMQCGLGDEEWVSLVAPGQFLQRYVFFVDPTYATTNLVVIRVAGDDGVFQDVDVECLGTIADWQPVGTGGRYEVAHVDLIRGGVGVGSCGKSRHEATSPGRFGVVVWGTDYYASYGYPAGGNVGAINDVVVPPVPN